MSPDQSALADRVREALRPVIDPELGESIIDLGLVYDVTVDDGSRATVLMTTTARFCPASDVLRQAAQERAAAVPGIAEVDVVMTYDPPWTPELMSPGLNKIF
jgi:metal-sulfur cluster biosynthetic enzyme